METQHEPAEPEAESKGRLADLYRELHAVGAAHSHELVRGDELGAGILAVHVGTAAMLESMCHRLPDAGNALLSRTLDALAGAGATLCDIQLPSPHTTALGARLIAREDYEHRLRAAVAGA